MTNINSEEPHIHWGFLNFKDRVVLDLGCARFYSSISTAQWFINGGAKQVAGVDLSIENISNPRLELIALQISNRADLQDLISRVKPEVIKCDIEKAEIHFHGIPPNEMSSVVEMAVEYHDPVTRAVTETMLKEWGFKNITLYSLMGESTDRIGVFHAVR